MFILFILIIILTYPYFRFGRAPAGIRLSPIITEKIGTALKFIFIQTNILFILLLKYNIFKIWLYIIILYGYIVGITLQISMFIDILRLLSIHFTILHIIFSIQHVYQISLIYSLFYLFQG